MTLDPTFQQQIRNGSHYNVLYILRLVVPVIH